MILLNEQKKENKNCMKLRKKKIESGEKYREEDFRFFLWSLQSRI